MVIGLLLISFSMVIGPASSLYRNYNEVGCVPVGIESGGKISLLVSISVVVKNHSAPADAYVTVNGGTIESIGISNMTWVDSGFFTFEMYTDNEDMCQADFVITVWSWHSFGSLSPIEGYALDVQVELLAPTPNNMSGNVFSSGSIHLGDWFVELKYSSQEVTAYGYSGVLVDQNFTFERLDVALFLGYLSLVLTMTFSVIPTVKHHFERKGRPSGQRRVKKPRRNEGNMM